MNDFNGLLEFDHIRLSPLYMILAPTTVAVGYDTSILEYWTGKTILQLVLTLTAGNR